MTTHSEPSVNVILLLSSSHSRIWSLIVGGMMGVWKRTRKSKNNENNGLRPNVSFFCLKTDIYVLYRFGVLSIGIRWKLSPKTHPFKNSLRRDDLWKHGFAVLVWIRRFLKTITSQSWISVCGSFLRRWCWWFSYYCFGYCVTFRVDKQKRLKKHSAWTPIFNLFLLKNGEEKSPF